MKKLVALLLALVMVISLCACGGKTAESEAAPTAAAGNESAAVAPAPAEDVTLVWGDWMLSEDAYVGIYGAMVENFDNSRLELSDFP